MCRHTRFALEASKEAVKSDQCYRHGAVITKGSKIVCRGLNRIRTSILSMKRASIHAEVDVAGQLIKRLYRRDYIKKEKGLSSYIIWVVRLGKDCDGNDVLRDSHPCTDCLNILNKCGFKKIGFTDQNGVMCLEKIDDLRNKGSYLSAAQRYVGRVCNIHY